MSPRIKKATEFNGGWKPASRKNSRKGAVLSVELVMVLPILLFVLLAFVEFGLMLMSQQGLAAASSLGARQAALTGATEASVITTVDNALVGWSWKPYRELVVLVNGNKISFVDLTDEILNAPTGTVISVSVNVQTDKAAPNLLKWIGIDTAGKDLTTTYVTRKE
ncbi:MAG: pilus assembly protein [Planctomycetales bacterium]|nr:pilus assembly protein [Planctomycetales bacterium]